MSEKEFAGLDFATGVVRGVRSFRIDKLGRLTGINYPQVWRPGENEAECRKDSDDPYGRLSRLLLGPLTYPPSYTYAGHMIHVQGNVRVDHDHVTDMYTISDGYSSKVLNAVEFAQMVGRNEPKKPHPMDKCLHGFYAYYDGSNDYHDQGEVTGVVEGYGETLIGTRGFRCMKARIVALRIHGRSADKITGVVARNYADIPQYESFLEMVAEFPPDGGEGSVSPNSDPDFWTRSI